MILLHIIDRPTWEVAQEAGKYTPSSLTTEGFIHLSTPEQIPFVANSFYRGQKGLVLLVVDSVRLSAPLQFDVVPEHGTFPHLYGPLNLDAVETILPFEPAEDGTFSLPEGISGA
jgi:uncharacterized protein (DUF952 family)